MAGTMLLMSKKENYLEYSLNGVRPRWPEQFGGPPTEATKEYYVSMESGLDGRNNCSGIVDRPETKIGLNGVRPRWPEQSSIEISNILLSQRSQWSPA